MEKSNSIWDRIAKEKVHFFRTTPILNVMMNFYTASTVSVIAILQGEWRMLLLLIPIPLIYIIWTLIDRRKLINPESKYNWDRNDDWVQHHAQLIRVEKDLQQVKKILEQFTSSSKQDNKNCAFTPWSYNKYMHDLSALHENTNVG